jgi:hypothetical protein
MQYKRTISLVNSTDGSIAMKIELIGDNLKTLDKAMNPLFKKMSKTQHIIITMTDDAVADKLYTLPAQI